MFSFLILALVLHGSPSSLAEPFAMLTVSIQLVWSEDAMGRDYTECNPCTSFTNIDESVSVVGWQGLLPNLPSDPAPVLILTTKYNVKFSEENFEEKFPPCLVWNNGELDPVTDVTSYYIEIINLLAGGLVLVCL